MRLFFVFTYLLPFRSFASDITIQSALRRQKKAGKKKQPSFLDSCQDDIKRGCKTFSTRAELSPGYLNVARIVDYFSIYLLNLHIATSPWVTMGAWITRLLHLELWTVQLIFSSLSLIDFKDWRVYKAAQIEDTEMHPKPAGLWGGDPILMHLSENLQIKILY